MKNQDKTLQELETAIIKKRKELGSTTSWVQYDKIEDELNELLELKSKHIDND